MAFLSAVFAPTLQSSSTLLALFRRFRGERIAVFSITALAVGFIVLHGVALTGKTLGYTADWLTASEYRLNADRSYSEMFLYALELSCVLLLFQAFWLSRQRLYLAWSAVFAFIFLDDAFAVHERVGKKLVSWFDLPGLPGLREQDTGELIVWGGAGIVLLSFAYREMKLSSAEAFGFCSLIALCFTTLVGFAVGLDMLHVVAGSWPQWAKSIVGVAEDGGEVLAIVAAWTCALLVRRHLVLIGRSEPGDR